VTPTSHTSGGSARTQTASSASDRHAFPVCRLRPIPVCENPPPIGEGPSFASYAFARSGADADFRGDAPQLEPVFRRAS